ncbi:MAG TPA: nuclear transport factor 2 family protein [Solirubrobacteraceae bacterium]|jgi:hypothetical protein|nr:nuclear transport factor 2 family protein [Solirubrobacteraceae bacterium]
MDDAVTRYRAASEVNDMDALMATLAPDVRIVSPISGRMTFSGSDDVRHLLGAVYGTLNGLHWHTETGDQRTRVIIGEGRVGPLRLGDAMVMELNDDGQIDCVRPHLRPWLALTLFALLLGPRVARRPGVVLRALRG